MEETKEFDQTETEEPKNEESEKTEIEAPKTEEPEKPETNEHDVPPVLEKPDLDIVDRIVIVEVVKEDDKKETQVQFYDQTENESQEDAAEEISEIETDTFFAEADEILVETETHPESDEETESDTDTASASDDAASDFDSDQTGSESEPETETQSVMLLNIDSDINTSYLQSIDLKLTCIIFILLFTVCERKMRYGVRSLCGRIKND